MSKTERLTDFNRQNIIRTAKQLFGENGITQTTMDDIAKASDYSKSTIYVYFKSKDEIYNSIVLEYIELLKKGVFDATSSPDGFTHRYFSLCNMLVDFYNTYPLYFESILGEIEIASDNSSDVLSQIYNKGEEINNIIKEYIEDGISKKEIKDDIVPLQTTFFLWVSICGIITLASKKKVYIQKAMHITKEEFMMNGFSLFLQSILP